MSLSVDQLSTAACPVLRWRLGRNYWRHDRDEGFRKNDYDVDAIEDRHARAFTVANHYTRSYPFARERFGLFRGKRLVGVAVFSTPINASVVPRYAGVESAAGLDLGRFILLDEVPYNAESFFLAAALKQLKRNRPDLSAVIAYSDPMPRQALDGVMVMPGHIGIAYQATNGRYMGRAASKTLHLTKDGQALSTRALSKVRLQEHGAASAEKRLVRLGAPKRAFGEDPRAWVGRALESGAFRRIRHPGNHVYVWSMERGGQSKVKNLGLASHLPYPKSHDLEQQSLFQ